MSRMTLELSPQLVECLGRLEEMVEDASRADLVCDALLFYEDILKRALSGKKIRLAESGAQPDFEIFSNVFPLNPTEENPASRLEKHARYLDERMRRAAEAGLIPQK